MPGPSKHVKVPMVRPRAPNQRLSASSTPSGVGIRRHSSPSSGFISNVFTDNFKPESIDVTRSGTIETRRPKEEGGPSTVTVVRPSQQVRHRMMNRTPTLSLNLACGRMTPVSASLVPRTLRRSLSVSSSTMRVPGYVDKYGSDSTAAFDHRYRLSLWRS